jgi:predicted nucleotidyltransferase component of viral defense system
MPATFLHQRKDFKNLILTLERETGILATLIEKDYWIMHVLYGLNELGLTFELKGGTSLSKGYKIIDRFSEDIDLHITPPDDFKKETGLEINENPKSSNKKHYEHRRLFFEWLADHINIDGITEVTRDIAFDDLPNYRSGGIRLNYKSHFDAIPGVKEGILLEAGFAKVTPNSPMDISSWAYDRASNQSIELLDNRALAIACYHSGYTLIEKLQTITAKFRAEQNQGEPKGSGRVNFMRQYYDVYQLLQRQEVVDFIGTEEYKSHKAEHFRGKDLEIPIAENEAFKLTDAEIRKEFKKRYISTAALYYNGQPDFDQMLNFISDFLEKLD